MVYLCIIIPVNIVDIDSGVYDMFYEPMDSVSESSDEFTRGLAKGSLSLMKHTVHGFSNTASKVTESIGNGISILSMDETYLKQRSKTAHIKPKHVGEGLLSGFQALGSGIIEGASGVLTKPIEGAMNDGVSGFFTGVGKGIIGVPVKPVAALFDFAHSTTEGIRNTTTYFEREDKKRSREPRAFHNYCLLYYDARAAHGQSMLYSLSDQAYYRSREPYEFHVTLPSANTIVLVTRNWIICSRLSDLTVQWKHALQDFCTCSLSRDSTTLVLKLTLEAQQKTVTGWLFTSSLSDRSIVVESGEDKLELGLLARHLLPKLVQILESEDTD